jgi:hypothetical protein
MGQSRRSQLTLRIANAYTNPDLFWTLKAVVGDSSGVVSKVTVRTHDLPDFFGVAQFTVKAVSDDAHQRLIREFISF